MPSRYVCDYFLKTLQGGERCSSTNKKGDNIAVVQNVSCHSERSEESCKVPARDPSVATLCQDDTNAMILVLLDNIYIIAIKKESH